jgi:hypothetical protein
MMRNSEPPRIDEAMFTFTVRALIFPSATGYRRIFVFAARSAAVHGFIRRVLNRRRDFSSAA